MAEPGKSFEGTWNIVSSPDFDDDYLSEEGTPYIRLHQEGGRLEGDYHVGLQTGDLSGWLESDNRAVFSFEGMDEMDEVSGAGTATVDDDRLTLTLMYHQGDDYTFEATRRP